MTTKRLRAGTDKEPIHVAELDEDGRLKITSVIDAVNSARAHGSATLDLQSRPLPKPQAESELLRVTDAVKAIVGLHALEMVVSEARTIPSASDEVVRMASVVITRPSRGR